MRKWQDDDKTRTATFPVLAIDTTAMAQGNRLDQRQAQANATVALSRAGQAVKRFKYPISQVAWNPRTAVAHPNLNRIVQPPQDQADIPSAMAACVLKQIAQGPAQQLGHAGHQKLG